MRDDRSSGGNVMHHPAVFGRGDDPDPFSEDHHLKARHVTRTNLLETFLGYSHRSLSAETTSGFDSSRKTA